MSDDDRITTTDAGTPATVANARRTFLRTPDRMTLAPHKAAVVLALLLALVMSCSIMRGKTASTEPVGCCCAYGDCRKALTQPECVKAAQFQGWTYTWHAGECTAQDVYPAPDYPPSSR